MSPGPAGAAGQTPWQALHGLAGTPAQFGPALLRALDEARRVEPPLTLIERYAAGQQQICGVTVPDGSAVFAMVASANRDTAIFGADAEEFRAGRVINAGQLLSLGHGIHECAGRDLQARLAPVALGALVQAMGDLRLRNPAAFPAWQSTVYFRVLQGLSVTCCPP
jgi:cytochrome P450